MITRANLLYLYSSNARPLYEQDILDVLAAPTRMPLQFRYKARCVERDTRTKWANLTGQKALINFSLQQEAEFHDPAFIPIRLATVTRAFHLGEIYIIQLTLGEYVSLLEPRQGNDKAGLAGPVRRYIEFLSQYNVPMPYDASAGLGTNILKAAGVPLDIQEDEMVLFSRTCRYLQKTLRYSG